MNIAKWLERKPRTDSEFSFRVIDLLERASARPSTSDFAGLMKDAYWGTEYLASVADRYGFEAVRDKLLASRADARPLVKRGDFGEALTIEYLKNVEGYRIPVMKLRYKMSPSQTLPGTDCVAFRVTNDELAGVAFIESKFRATLDLAVAVNGAKQLQQDAESENPEILSFVARRLKDVASPLAELVEAYIFERNVELDEYLLVILHEETIWDERILANLEDEELELHPLHVYAARVSELKELAESAFSELELEVIEDDY